MASSMNSLEDQMEDQKDTRQRPSVARPTSKTYSLSFLLKTLAQMRASR